MEDLKSSNNDKKLKGIEGLLLKILFFMTIIGFPLASVILLNWAIRQ